MLREAGRRPERIDDVPAGAPPDERPPCPAAAGARLAALLDLPDRRWLLAEWLALLVEAGCAPPAEHLPALLDLGVALEELRPAIRAASLGRGAWLAALEPRWSYALPADLPDAAAAQQVWSEGDVTARLALVEALRASDPEAARALVQTTFADEAPEVRAAPPGAAGDGPVRRRRAAAGSGPRRPPARGARGGRRAARPPAVVGARGAHAGAGAAARARRAGGARAARGRPAGELDAALLRDGVAKRARAGLGERASWLAGILEATPLAGLQAHLGRPPAEALALPGAEDWHAMLLPALATAAVRQGDAGWAEALLQAGVDRQGLGDVLPPEARERLLLGEAAADRLAAAPVSLLTADGGWSGTLTRGVLRALERARDPKAVPPQLAYAIAAHGDPARAAQADELADRLAIHDERLARVLRAVAETLHVRRAMIEELRCQTTP